MKRVKKQPTRMCLKRHAQLSLSILVVMAGAGLLTASMDTDPPTGYEEEIKCYSINVSTVCDTTVSTVATTTVPVTTSALTSSSKVTTSTVSVTTTTTTTTTEMTTLTTTEPVIATTQTIVTELEPEPEVVPEPTEPYVPEPAVADASTDSGLPISEYERVLLCNVVANEYGSDWVPIYDKACVVATVMNRVADSRFPSTIEGVLTQPYQFSGYWCSSSYYSTVTQSCIDAVDYYFAHSSEFPYYLYFDGGHYAADGSGPYNYFR